MNRMGKRCEGSVAALTLALVLALGWAGAANAGNPNRDNQTEAEAVCGLPGSFPLDTDAGPTNVDDAQAQACNLTHKTDSTNGFVEYFGRNSDRAEDSLISKAAGVVLKLEDFLTASNPKNNKLDDAVVILCAYQDKILELLARGKLVQGEEEVLGDGDGDEDGVCDAGEACQDVDLFADAGEILSTLGRSCGG